MSKALAPKNDLPEQSVNFVITNDGRRSQSRGGKFSGQSRVHPTFKRGMRSRVPVIFGFAVIVFAIAFVSLILVIANTNPSEAVQPQAKVVVVEKDAPIAMVDVLVPIGEIKQGEKLDPAMFKMSRRAKISIGGDVLKSVEELKGFYARSPLLKEQPVSRELISQVRPSNPVISNIQPGFRAVTINVNATTGVEGWATAGASVDVHWISDVLGERTASLIVQNAKVLSAERQVEGAQPNGQPIPTTVTLLVSEKDAQKISLASTGGSIMLHLRGAQDAGKGSTASTLTYKDLVGKGSKDDGAALEGFARTKGKDGSVQEWALVGGKLVRKSS